MPARRPKLGLVFTIVAAFGAAAAVALHTLEGEDDAAPGATQARNPGDPAAAGASARHAGPSAVASPDRHQVEPADRAGRVAGAVTELTTGHPVAGVALAFRGPGGAETTTVTGADGRYAVDLAPGVHEVSATGDAVLSLAPTYVAVAPDAAAEAIDLEVATLAHLTGRVVDRDGAPLARVRVRHRTRLAGATLTSAGGEPIAEAFTADDGSFALRVPPGDVVLVATQVGRPATTAAIPGVLPGGDIDDVTIAMGRGVRVEGVVAAEDGTPVSGARIVLTRDDGAEPVETTSDTGGRFAFDAIAPGRVELQAEAEGYAASQVAAVEAAASDAPRSRVGLVVRPGLAITGLVADRDGAPVAGARVRARPTQGGLGGGETTTGGDGRFRLEGLRRATFELLAEAEGVAPARRERLAAPADGVALTLLRPGGIAGTVTAGGAPVRDVAVRITAVVAPGGEHRAAPGVAPLWFATLDGAYRIDDLAPGAYTVVVSARGHAPVEKTDLQVGPGSYADGSASLPGAATVTGRVVDAGNGAAIAGARVGFASGHERFVRMTGPDGAFTIAGAGAGPRSLEVRHPAYAARVHPVELGPGDTRRVEIALDSAGAATPAAGAGTPE